MPLQRFFVLAALLISSAGTALAGGLQSLENFIKTVKTGRASFTQVVTAPAKHGQPAHVKSSNGEFLFARPQRFKFIYSQPFAQVIVADGQTLWLYDVDLNQVSQRAQQQALGTTPAALIAAATDSQALQADFVLRNEPDQDGLQWLLATPKAKDSQLQAVRIAFKTSTNSTPTLAVLEITDTFGQRSVLRFEHFEINPSLPDNTFAFKPPPGVDVLKQ